MFKHFNQSAPSQRYLFISDIHGFDPNLNKILGSIQSIPEIAFYLGDIVGTSLLDQLQKLFYNGIYNPMRKLLEKNKDPNDVDIFEFFTEEGINIIDGCQKMRDFLMELDPDYIPEPCPEMARTLSKYIHFGHFVGNLSTHIREILQKDMEINAQKNIKTMSSFCDRGSLVTADQGNWDARTPLDFYPDGTVIPLEKRNFNFKEFLSRIDPRILYFDEVGTIETDDCIFIIWPFDSAIDEHTPIPEISNPDNKKIVLVSHAQVSWEAVKGKTPMTGEGQKIDQHMPLVVEQLKVNAVVHGHLHDQLHDGADGYILPTGTYVHYLPIQTCRFIDF